MLILDHKILHDNKTLIRLILGGCCGMKEVRKAVIAGILSISIFLLSSCTQNSSGGSAQSDSGEEIYGPHIELYNPDMPKKVMLGDNVTLRFSPSEDSETYNEISHFLVTLIAVVRTDHFDQPENEDGLWGLVYCFQLDNSVDNVGWVPFRELTEYSEENKHLLRYPVQLKEGCKDLDTGDEVKWDNVLVTYEEDYAIVSWEGGHNHRVSPDDIVYPDVKTVNTERLH